MKNRKKLEQNAACGGDLSKFLDCSFFKFVQMGMNTNCLQIFFFFFFFRSCFLEEQIHDEKDRIGGAELPPVNKFNEGRLVVTCYYSLIEEDLEKSFSHLKFSRNQRQIFKGALTSSTVYCIVFLVSDFLLNLRFCLFLFLPHVPLLLFFPLRCAFFPPCSKLP